MYKHRRFKTGLSSSKWISPQNFKDYFPRQPILRLNRLHPDAKKIYNKMIQTPAALDYKLQTLPTDHNNEIALGNTSILPFQITRTAQNSLPVYTDYKYEKSASLTVIRRLTGDVEAFKTEVKKIVSNSKVEHRMGKVIVTGLHTQKIKLWLTRLGF